LIVVFADHADGTTVPKIPSRNAVGNQALVECVPLGVPKSPQTPSSIGGSAHHLPPKHAEPGQCSGVNWLESMMATTADSENMRGCNTVELSRRSVGPKSLSDGQRRRKHRKGAEHMQTWANQPLTC